MWKIIQDDEKQFVEAQNNSGLACKLLIKAVWRPSVQLCCCDEFLVEELMLIFIHCTSLSLYFFLDLGSKGCPLSLPLSLMPKARSILARTAWFGIALPCSYSVTTWGFSQIFVARSFCDISFAWRPAIRQMSISTIIQVLWKLILWLTLSDEFANTKINSFVFQFFSLRVKLGCVETGPLLSVASSSIPAINQSEMSIVLCQPIRYECCSKPTNQIWVLF